jgi:RimJ/RimL family protein N-acetyltransferase
MPFFFPWTDAEGDALRTNTAQFLWRKRAEFRPEEWTLLLAVRHEGRLVGIQALETKDYLVTRSAETGSWLGLPFQGKGIGTTMRRAVCALAFDHLDADEVTSGAFVDNPSSLAVSRKVGYRDNGRHRSRRRQGELAVRQASA